MSNILFFSPFRVHHLEPMRSPLFLAIIALALLLIAMETARPRYFLHDDNASWFSGAYLHDYRVLTETGRLAEVNWYQHGGEPFLQQGQTAVLYPPVYLGVTLAKVISGDTLWTIEWVAALHLALGLLGFYFWMRQGGIDARFAALGALAWVLNPFVLIFGSCWIFVIIVAAWLPWLFWSLDRLLARPSARHALYLGVSMGMLFLQGYVQMFAYALLFVALYAPFQFLLQPRANRGAILYYFGVAMLIGAALALPLLLPMFHATAQSAVRANPLPPQSALMFSVVPRDILAAQFCQFGSSLFFGVTIAVLFCPALFLLPAAALGLIRPAVEIRRRLIALVLLGLLALLLSTRWHVLLTILPIFDRFRWPFKIFLFTHFFLLAALTSWTGSRSSSSRRANLTALSCLAVVVLANLSISLAFHDGNLISTTTIPPAAQPLPPGVDPHLGRAVTFSQGVSDAEAYRCLTFAYATYFAFPTLGGYDPLVGLQQVEFSLGIDYPNIWRGVMTPDFQKAFENRAVRYWIVDARSPQLATIASLPGMKPLDRDEQRLVFEDLHAAPLAFAAASPAIPIPVTYSGNSILVPVTGINSPLTISAGPTDGWWYRIDGGPWQRPSYQDGWLTLQPGPSAHLAEITYFDSPFRQGLLLSAILIALAVILIAVPTQFRA
jgi:hypothetical protein